MKQPFEAANLSIANLAFAAREARPALVSSVDIRSGLPA